MSRQVAGVELIECAPLARLAPHVFTTRALDVRSGRDGAREAWGRVARLLDVEPDRLYRPAQVHGVAVVRAPFDGRFDQDVRPRADIVVAGEHGIAVAVQTADCVPVLIGDAGGRAVAAVHAGWRGTAAGAVAAAVRALHDTFASDPADLVAAIGPSIGPCCYEVGPEVRAAFAEHGHASPDLERWFERGATGKYHLDLWSVNRDQLLRAGLPQTGIHVSGACTVTEPARFFSHRREGEASGRMVAAIRAGG